MWYCYDGDNRSLYWETWNTISTLYILLYLKLDYVSRIGYLKVTTWYVFKLLASFRHIWITITSILYIFCGTWLALTHTGYTLYQYHGVSAAIFELPLCSMNMDTRMVLLCFYDVHLTNRLLLSRLLVYSILPYLCKNIWSTNDRVKIWYFSNYHASNILVIIRLK